MNTSTERPIDRWFASYSGDHRNDTNQWIHVFAVPLILWSVIALLWCIPVPPGGWFRPGIFAAFAMLGAWLFYYRASRYFAEVRAITSAGSLGAGGVLSQSSVSR